MRTRFNTILAVLVIAAGAQGSERLGYIETVHGKVFLKRADGVIRQLSPTHDLARLVYADDRVRAEGGGWIRIQTGAELVKVPLDKDWMAIPRGAKSIPKKIEVALERYGRIGGRPRSVETRSHTSVIAPAHDSAVAARWFVIELVPGESDCSVSLELRDMNRVVLWRVDGHRVSMKLDAGPPREKVAARQAEARVRLELEPTGDCIDSRIVEFELLSRDEENALGEELATWDEATHGVLLSRLGRASVFAEYDLHREVAAEYEAALVAAPQSIDLLARTIAAHDMIENLSRKAELVQKLNVLDPPKE